VRTTVETVRVQREPFEAKGERAEAFAPGTRFAKERLWHVEISFNAPIAGPLVIGDGRFLGLGVMAPVKVHQGVHAFDIERGLAARSRPTDVARALRRAVMARVQRVVGRPALPAFFSGHEEGGAPARTEHHPHLTFTFDPDTARLIVIAPHVMERRNAAFDETAHLQALEEALTDFRELRAGTSGHLTLRASAIDHERDSLFAPSRTWRSATLYQVTRHAKRASASEAICDDVRRECCLRGLPDLDIVALQQHGVPGVGLVGRLELNFRVAVRGPILLGRGRHLGGGLFTGLQREIGANTLAHD
jgi:CRISPR-associated protein Csb2